MICGFSDLRGLQAILHADDARDTFGSVDATSTGSTGALLFFQKAGRTPRAPDFRESRGGGS